MEKGPSPFLSEIVGRLVKKAQQAEQVRKVKEKEKQSPITAEKSKTTDSSDISTTVIESPKDLIEKSKESKRQTVTASLMRPRVYYHLPVTVQIKMAPQIREGRIF